MKLHINNERFSDLFPWLRWFMEISFCDLMCLLWFKNLHQPEFSLFLPFLIGKENELVV